ncbi:MAG TPA: hypothetical protein PLO51_05660 [Candidatus Micrarchaeota archaeon]|nr:hypothetical protein [Candidatus Micrarchaeota archaeon]
MNILNERPDSWQSRVFEDFPAMPAKLALDDFPDLPVKLLFANFPAFPVIFTVPFFTDTLAPSARAQPMAASASSQSGMFEIALVPFASAAMAIALCAMLFDGGALILPLTSAGNIVNMSNHLYQINNSCISMPCPINNLFAF